MSVMGVQNLFAQVQSYAGTCGLGGVERNKQAFLHIGGDALPVVLHIDNHIVLHDIAEQAYLYALSRFGEASMAFLIRLMSTCSICPRSAWKVKPG